MLKVSHQQNSLILEIQVSTFDSDASRATVETACQDSEGKSHLIIDLGQVRLIDSGGLSGLARLLKRLTKDARELRLVNVQPGVQLGLEVTNFIKIVKISQTIEEAIQSLPVSPQG